MQVTDAVSVGMPAEQYHASRGLSNSGLSDLAVSPLRYWYLHVNPNRPKEEPTPAMQFGSALHCAVLEPSKLDSQYCQKFDGEDIEGCLVTMDDLRGWLKDQGIQPKGTRKADVIAQVQSVDANVPILDVLKEAHDARHAGKVQFNRETWMRIGGAAQALRDEPRMREFLKEGKAEQSFFVESVEGVPLRSRMDWINDALTLDLKTLSAHRGRPFDRMVSEAIWYEGYYRTAYFYSLVRALASGDRDIKGPQRAPKFALAFVESEPPHEVRIREVRPIEAGSASLLWERARVEVQTYIGVYKEYMDKFGEKPWRYAQESEALVDEEFPALVYGR